MPPGYIHVYGYYFQTPSSPKPHGQLKLNFMWGLLVKREHRFCRNGLGNMTKMLPCPYIVKTVTNLLQNPNSDDLETWHAALKHQARQRLYK